MRIFAVHVWRGNYGQFYLLVSQRNISIAKNKFSIFLPKSGILVKSKVGSPADNTADNTMSASEREDIKLC